MLNQIYQKWWFWLLLFILAMIFIFYIFCYTLVSRYDHQDVQNIPKKAGIVLGAALWDGRLSPALKERCDKALELYQRQLVQYIILSGGVGNDQISEAQAMKRYLVKRGIPAEQLILEDQSTNTLQNLKNSKKILQDRQIEEVYIITHDYHLYRSLKYAKQLHIKATPAPVHSQVMWMPYHKTRECLALVKQQLLQQ